MTYTDTLADIIQHPRTPDELRAVMAYKNAQASCLTLPTEEGRSKASKLMYTALGELATMARKCEQKGGTDGN